MEGDAPCWEGDRGGPRWAEWGGAGHRVTGAASVRLFGLFADRLLCHHEPQASLLRVRWGVYGGFDHNHRMYCVSGGGDRRRRQRACFQASGTAAAARAAAATLTVTRYKQSRMHGRSDSCGKHARD
eukprot:scaffold53217_cov71-Phaeocystis_antarctica.AAC.3